MTLVWSKIHNLYITYFSLHFSKPCENQFISTTKALSIWKYVVIFTFSLLNCSVFVLFGSFSSHRRHEKFKSDFRKSLNWTKLKAVDLNWVVSDFCRRTRTQTQRSSWRRRISWLSPESVKRRRSIRPPGIWSYVCRSNTRKTALKKLH